MSSRDPDRLQNVPQDETAITDITIGPDGRVYIFGASMPVLEVLEAAGLGGTILRRRLDRLRDFPRQKSKQRELIRQTGRSAAF